MAQYRRLTGEPEEGEIVVRIIKEGDARKAFITNIENTGDPAEPSVFPPEEMSPEEAFRIVENKRDMIGDAEVRVMLEAGIEWDPAWGELVE
ncbi:hypothetical protein [Fulvimarina sp. MAC3]|uniref:hypothetical protein n=1 Tax=Fulvimarina sp. MAC3 TaxID=3148887 RepID=UPI0031FCD1DD